MHLLKILGTRAGSEYVWLKGDLAYRAMSFLLLTVWLFPLLRTGLAWPSYRAVLVVMGALFSAWLLVQFDLEIPHKTCLLSYPHLCQNYQESKKTSSW